MRRARSSGAVGYQDGAGSLLHQMARGQLAHLARANQEDRAALERSEDLARQLDGHRGDGNRVRANFSFGADLFGGGKGALQQVFELAADGARSAGHGESLFHLAQNLRLAHHHRVQAGGHAEQMANGVLVAVLIEVRRENRRVEAEVPMQKAGRSWASGVIPPMARISTRLHVETIMHSVTPGTAARARVASGRSSRRDGDPLAQLDGRGFVVDADKRQGHRGPNL